MSAPYRVFGAELSPYSVKVRSYFRYKGLAHEWVPRNVGNEEEFRRYAKLPLIPLVVTPEGEGIQDSTPIIERFERLHPEPPIHPSDPTLAFLSALLEEYGDEWGNKAMFHYRWFYEPDQASAAARLVDAMMPGLEGDARTTAVDTLRERMVPRLRFVGSSAATKDQIERSFERLLALLETHLAARPFLFGARPAFADFGLFAQLYECSLDPTAGALMRARAARVLDWCERMLAPRAAGPFESWATLEATMMPLVRDEVAAVFLPWTTANARAFSAGQKTFSVTLEGEPFRQDTQKYHVKSLGVLKARYARVADRAALDPILRQAGCLAWLT